MGLPGLSQLQRRVGGADGVFAAYRLFVAVFLAWGVWDNVVSSERMQEFAAFLRANGFPLATIMAHLSVWTQLASAISMGLGLLARWGGLLCAANFIVALIMVDGPAGFRQAFPAAMLVLFGLYLATRGPGRFSLDAALGRHLRS